ncbi:AAA family ATPase [Frateuria edaphi]|uniref:trifunctional serine/threonine-protein kinase/ATP-binding protein/sensor histidine kinase n=1 Tax=Frateuria edaphi TaxID=2898793 RepID=UPI001E4640E9|nr:AAA family ATPase [Frateuria edaphi]UGB45445.1 AAA family ATPase [Frateuria edaphi]
MALTSLWGIEGGHASREFLWDDGEREFHRASLTQEDGTEQACIAVLPLSGRPHSAVAEGLKHEYALRAHLDGEWALRPIDLLSERGRTLLLLEHQEGEPLERRLDGRPMELSRFLRLALSLAGALGRVHESGLVHRDIKPTNVLVAPGEDRVMLFGFGIASRLPRERQAPDPPELIAGTLAYMAPEQTGRMNRSVDSRSDLYSLGVLLYRMVAGALPFNASDPMEWVHCHIARRPPPPVQCVPGLPVAVSDLIMRLLSKMPEDRYQTARGVAHDLRLCIDACERGIPDAAIALGEHDHPGRLVIPEKLYGREAEIEQLIGAFNDVVETGAPALVLVAGYSGIGKSSVVNELHKVLVSPRGLFASGKFDQYKAGIPYATFAQAFRQLVRPLLARPDDELAHWRDAFADVLGPNGALLLDLVPELKLIIGEQPPVVALPARDAQRRFQLAVRRFISVFARPEHPLALFLDDLQWLDSATLDLLGDLLTAGDMRHVLLIGAYRDNEVSMLHPLARTLDALRQHGADVRTLILPALTPRDLQQLVAESLRAPAAQMRSLAELIHARTGGNPFFAIQFLKSLAEEGLLAFDHATMRWTWDRERTLAKGYSDNIVDLMVRKLSRLPPRTLATIQTFACLGHASDLQTLSAVCETSAEDLEADLWEALRQELVRRHGSAYRFVHDRVQEAAYSQVPSTARAAAHLRIGRLLAAHTPADRREEAIFEIVNQYNRAAHLLESVHERLQVAAFNLVAARRARASTAYASALTYLRAGRALLAEDDWTLHYELMFALESLIAECELMTADLDAAERRLEMLARRAGTRHDFATVTRLRLTLYTTRSRGDLCVEVFLDYLRRNGTDWTARPPREVVMQEYERIWAQLGDRSIEDLVDLPLATDPDVLDMLDVFTEIVTPAFFFDENLSSLVLCRMVNLSLEHGHSDGSCFGYVFFATFAGPRFGNYRDGYRFGRLGYELVEQRGLTRYQARTYIVFGNMVMPWFEPFASGRDLIRRAFDTAFGRGDLTFAAYSWDALITNCLAAGDELAGIQADAETGLAFARDAGFGMVVDLCAAQVGLIRTLRGLTPRFGCFDDDDYDEAEAEAHLTGSPVLALATFFYWTRKLQGRYFCGDLEEAIRASDNADRLLWTSPSQLETADFFFYGALAHAARWHLAPLDERGRHFDIATRYHRQLEIWAGCSAANFENRAALVGAEIARIEGRMLEAEHLYEAAIRSARDNGHVHNEAVANECAGNFFLVRGMGKAARAYLSDAQEGYRRWGAQGKVRQLERLHPGLDRPAEHHDASRTWLTPVEQLDLATVIQVSQAISSAIEVDRLVDTIMHLAIEHAGAERGLLILPRGAEYRIEADAVTHSDTVDVLQQSSIVTGDRLPLSVFQYVLRTQEPLLITDATTETAFSQDPYLIEHASRSLLCLPLLKQARLIGVLYLENRLASHVFTPARIAVLKLLASEAAISLENIRLYKEVQEREARVRRLFNSNIIGIFTWALDGRIIDGNDAFLEIIGYDSADRASGRMQWKALLPPEWAESNDRVMQTMLETGVAPPFEGELMRKDGSRVPVLIGAALFEATPTEGVSFVLDLSDRVAAEAAASDSLRRYHEVQLRLADANRVASIGQLSASIAHELNQPLAGIMTNASTCLRMLAVEPPATEGAMETARRTIRDANRASEVIKRLRSLFARKETFAELVDLNEAAGEVVALASNALLCSQVSLRTEFADRLPLVTGDRVQLQQVILNLLTNASDAMSTLEQGRPRQLVIRTRFEKGEGVRLSVQDSGIGLDPRQLEKYFEAFYTTKDDGMGVGLSISRTIIETHRGRLWAEPNQDGGATFSFVIPLVAGEVRAALDGTLPAIDGAQATGAIPE